MQHYRTKVSITHWLLKQQRNQFLKNTVFWYVTLCSLIRRPNKRCYALREGVGDGTFLPHYMELEAIRRRYPSKNERCENPRVCGSFSWWRFIFKNLYTKQANDLHYEQFHITYEKVNVPKATITTSLEMSQLYLPYIYCILLIFRFSNLF